MNGKTIWVVAVGLAVVQACGREEAGLEGTDRTGYEELATASDTSERFGDTTAAPVVPVQGDQGPAQVTPGGPLTASGNLRWIADERSVGSVTVTEANGGTEVRVEVTSFAEGERLTATVARGSCDDRATPLGEVGEVEVESAGIGTLTGTVAVPTRRMLDGRHSVQLHRGDFGDPALVLACANLPPLET